MSFLGKVKQVLGIGTVKVELVVPSMVPKANHKLPGKVTLTGKSDQHVLDLVVQLKEEWTIRRGDKQEKKEFELGKIQIAKVFDMQANQTLTFDFELPFTVVKSENDEMKEVGGVMGFLGKAQAFADGEKSSYKVIATADVKGAALDPMDIKYIRLT